MHILHTMQNCVPMASYELCVFRKHIICVCIYYVCILVHVYITRYLQPPQR